jgi:hypothetical protein
MHISRHWFLLSWFAASCFASDLTIHLPSDSSLTAAPDIYVESIVDSRVQKSDIGFAMTGLFNTRSQVHLQGGLPKELMDYFDRVVPKQEGKRPVVVNVKEFQVSERTGATAEYARAEVELDFYLKTKRGLGRIYSAQAFVETPSTFDVTDFHPSNLAYCINQCLRLLAKQKYDETSLIYIDSVRVLPATREDPSFATPNLDPKPVYTVILASGTLGFEAHGGALRLLRYENGSSKWIFPRAMEIEAVAPKQRNGTTGNFGMFVPGVTALRELGIGDLHLLLDAGVPFGFENSTNSSGTQSSRVFAGLSTGESLVLLPIRRRGIALQAGLYQIALANSRLYPYDLGVCLGAGIQL